ncbi:membrane-spanning 4-domains subfamily A member 12-like [Dipodomys merriami]|uniref:membrane-spanning 4-domains subfamily A member 12-like n=1 Tax=Dipodomys merriami TaxID=94247 RepID=UPI0038560C6A
MPRRITIKKEAKALGASQIMISLIHIALGTLWIFLYQLQNEQEQESNKKDVPMFLLIIYSFISSLYFIISGSSSIIQGVPTECKLTLAIVTNITSVFVAFVGLVILCVGFISFESSGNKYIWINMACMMLLQFTVLSTVSVIVVASLLIHWMRKAFHYEEFNEESSSSSSSPPSIHINIR